MTSNNSSRNTGARRRGTSTPPRPSVSTTGPTTTGPTTTGPTTTTSPESQASSATTSPTSSTLPTQTAKRHRKHPSASAPLRSDGSSQSKPRANIQSNSRGPRATMVQDSVRTLEGTFSVHPRGFGFVTASGDEDDVFVPAPVLRGRHLYTGDLVRVHYTEDRRAAFEIEAVKRARTSVFGTLVRFGGTVKLVPDPWVGADEMTLKPSTVKESGFHPGEGVIVALTPGREITGFGSATKPAALQRRALERFQLAELDTTVAIPTPDISVSREDLTGLFTFTIDGPDSRDLDDAISVARRGDDLVLYVHIADVASAVPVGSPADRRARALATSVYLPGYSLPMFPPELSYDECSLIPNVLRRTLTVEYAVTPEDLVTRVKVYHSLIRSDTRLTYEQAARALEGQVLLDPATQAALELTNEATTRLGEARAKRGGLISDRFEPIFDLSTKGDVITAVTADDAAIAHDLIEEAMVAANEAVAEWLIANNLPGVYRVHPAPGPDVIAAIEALALGLGIPVTPGPELTPYSLALVDAQLRTHPGPVAPLWAVVSAHLERATYQSEPGHHFGLASDAYVHFTSPIRRYADLTVHRIITAHLTGTEYEEDLGPLCEHINTCTSLAARAEIAARSLLWACFLRALPDAKRRALDARVVKVSEKGIVIALNEYGASGWILARDLDPAGIEVDEHGLSATGYRRGKWDLGQALVVNVGDIDVESGLVSFRLAY